MSKSPQPISVTSNGGAEITICKKWGKESKQRGKKGKEDLARERQTTGEGQRRPGEPIG